MIDLEGVHETIEKLIFVGLIKNENQIMNMKKNEDDNEDENEMTSRLGR